MTDKNQTDTAFDRKIEEISDTLLRCEQTDKDWSELERLKRERRRRIFNVFPVPDRLTRQQYTRINA